MCEGVGCSKAEHEFGFGRFYLEVPKPKPKGLGDPKVGYPNTVKTHGYGFDF